jgi:hypothetical protein
MASSGTPACRPKLGIHGWIEPAHQAESFSSQGQGSTILSAVLVVFTSYPLLMFIDNLGKIPMASITIKDLNESREMDREAMRAVAGGCASSHFTNAISPYHASLMSTAETNKLFDWATFNSHDST